MKFENKLDEDFNEMWRNTFAKFWKESYWKILRVVTFWYLQHIYTFICKYFLLFTKPHVCSYLCFQFLACRIEFRTFPFIYLVWNIFISDDILIDFFSDCITLLLPLPPYGGRRWLPAENKFKEINLPSYAQ